MTSLASSFTARVSNAALPRSLVQYFAMKLMLFLLPQNYDSKCSRHRQQFLNNSQNTLLRILYNKQFLKNISIYCENVHIVESCEITATVVPCAR